MPQAQELREFTAERRQREGWRKSKDVPAWAFEMLSSLDELRTEVAALRNSAPKASENAESPVESAESDQVAKDVRVEIAQMVRTIGRAKAEIAAIKHPDAEDDRIVDAASELDAIVASTENATESILEAAEKIEHLAQQLTEQHADNEEIVIAGNKLMTEATTIFQACNFQDITGQRIQKVVKTLRFIEGRILAMIDIWGRQAFEELPIESPAAEQGDDNLMNGPQLENQGLTQADIDALMA